MQSCGANCSEGFRFFVSSRCFAVNEELGSLTPTRVKIIVSLVTRNGKLTRFSTVSLLLVPTSSSVRGGLDFPRFALRKMRKSRQGVSDKFLP